LGDELEIVASWEIHLVVLASLLYGW